jgi:hypothetical protein
MFRSDDEDAVGASEFAFVADDFGGQAAFEILIEHRQIVDAQEIRLEAAGAELRLIESRRLLPTMTARLGLAMAPILWFKLITGAK